MSITILVCDLAASVGASVGLPLDANRDTSLRSGGFVGVSLGLSGPLWVLWASLGFLGPLWASLGLSGPRWASLGLSGPLWASLGLSGRVWASLGRSGPLWASLVAIRDCLAQKHEPNTPTTQYSEISGIPPPPSPRKFPDQRGPCGGSVLTHF